MKGPHPLITSRAGLISVLLVYIFIITLILFFAGQIFSDLSTEDIPSRIFLVPIAILLPAFLLGNIVLNIVRIVKEKREKRAGVYFKIKLILFFSFVAFVSAIPQAIITMNFLNTAVNTWLDQNHSGAIKGGIDVALTLYRERVENLEAVPSSPFFSYTARNLSGNPERMWNEISDSFPYIHSFQVFENGKTVYFSGEEGAMLTDDNIIQGEKGLLTRVSAEGRSIIRVQKDLYKSGKNYIIILGSFLPDDFDKKAEKLTTSYDIFTQLENYQSFFIIIILVVLIFFSLPIFLLTLIISFKLSEETLQPIIHLEEATRRVAEGDYSFRILTRPGDSISVLVNSFNAMIKELEIARKKNMQSDKINAWKEIARRMAHEIKNPLTPIKLSSERLKKRYEKQDPNFGKILDSSVNVIVTEVDRLNKLLTEFSNFARMPSISYDVSSPGMIIKETVEMFSASLKGIDFDISGVEYEEKIYMDREKIKQVLINLLSNSIDAVGGAGTIQVRTDILNKENILYYRIQISDNGSGISDKIREQVFSPYFTTRNSGTGLGLAIVERIIFDHNGAIWFDSEKGVGSTFYIDLPVEENYVQNTGN
jgi:nitrogen fixation/metabolism regulation signal transduction histidine kinase